MPPRQEINRGKYSKLLSKQIISVGINGILVVMERLPDKIRPYIDQLGDVRVIGQVVFVFIVLMISYSGVKVIYTNYQLQQQIAATQQQNDIQKLQNENQKLKNQYYNSSQYLELSARENFGLAAPGEKELLVPKAVAMAYVPSDMSSATAQVKKSKHQLFFVRNMQTWFDFFLRRTPDTSQ